MAIDAVTLALANGYTDQVSKTSKSYTDSKVADMAVADLVMKDIVATDEEIQEIIKTIK